MPSSQTKFLTIRAYRGARLVQPPGQTTYHTTYRVLLSPGDTVKEVNIKLAECIKSDPHVTLARPDLPWALFRFDSSEFTKIDRSPVLQILAGDVSASDGLGPSVLQYAFQLPDAKQVCLRSLWCRGFVVCADDVSFLTSQLDEARTQYKAIKTPFGTGWSSAERKVMIGILRVNETDI